ncbi:phosphoribosylaminoimidazolesuccinocarboxamide synthase [Bdellovibrio bacteriovorus]|uniref:phosphoribosylaminoimidazolesuccinocarboxamide synthase n=1 Tax=Bdellovibrio bacteriovorus (strain ATCC 15356 / DSM 50701 / NCIMB 9529 / HD100) TaxID=264462 RepID=Q6MIY7_BDEBA|nr:phosphoribosylaminoimidazolesuccinocarboxamide synthase [Bdellovibrio bacteriovorus]CAE80776.1 phosphoribosylaminoimidazolesuccinocarboxamide synthase [Bdellovibrio bacteriovorus HD100]
MNLIYRGSVKDLYQNNDKIVFEYSNRYSIFDWGEMPDEIPHKGEALAAMASMFFEHLSARGFSSHYLSGRSRTSIEVQPVKVLRPEWKGEAYDYSMYASRPTQCLVPLEVIFRRHLGQGNSLEGRLKKNPAYLADLELSKMPTSADSFMPALVEVSTKLETTDRYLSKADVAAMNVVNDAEYAALRKNTQDVAAELEKLFASFGVKLWDGKLEFAFTHENNGQRGLVLVDSIGPDELRLTYEGLPLSKEFLRQIYAGSEWSEAVKKAKDLAKERKTEAWKSICENELGQRPAALNAEQIQVSSWLYLALANEIATVLNKPRPFDENINLKFWHQKALSLLEKKP